VCRRGSRNSAHHPEKLPLDDEDDEGDEGDEGDDPA
jgi:hypothetical protein